MWVLSWRMPLITLEITLCMSKYPPPPSPSVLSFGNCILQVIARSFSVNSLLAISSEVILRKLIPCLTQLRHASFLSRTLKQSQSIANNDIQWQSITNDDKQWETMTNKDIPWQTMTTMTNKDLIAPPPSSLKSYKHLTLPSTTPSHSLWQANYCKIGFRCLFSKILLNKQIARTIKWFEHERTQNSCALCAVASIT